MKGKIETVRILLIFQLIDKRIARYLTFELETHYIIYQRN
jgi:hypothetical protein